jgi:hypothetical protein
MLTTRLSRKRSSRTCKIRITERPTEIYGFSLQIVADNCLELVNLADFQLKALELVNNIEKLNIRCELAFEPLVAFGVRERIVTEEGMSLVAENFGRIGTRPKESIKIEQRLTHYFQP